MKTTGNGLLCDIKVYNAMLNAYAESLTEFEYNGIIWNTDDIFIDFERDLKNGKIKVSAKIN